MKKLAVVILNYRRAEMTIGCMESLESELAGRDDACAIVVDNGSDDESAGALEAAIRERGWASWCTLVASPTNGGFAAGNNLGFKAVEAEGYMLLNSDARATPGLIAEMITLMADHPNAGLIGPRLIGPEGETQVSCFRVRSPLTEFLSAAATGAITRLFGNVEVGIEPTGEAIEPHWMSFACVTIRREVIDRIGPMDEQYFMYFEDIDYCRQIRGEGWTILHDPKAAVIHLRGGTSSVKSAIRERQRVPRYYYEARSRYFAKFYGGTIGLWLANLSWMAGRAIAFVREVVGNKKPHTCAGEWLDNWTNWGDPMQPPRLPGGGEL